MNITPEFLTLGCIVIVQFVIIFVLVNRLTEAESVRIREHKPPTPQDGNDPFNRL